MPIPARSEAVKIELTLSQEHKQTLEKAAAQRLLSLSEYLTQVALEVAQEMVTTEPVVLSEQDWQVVTSALKNPLEPNQALKAAVQEHQEKYGEW
jgi:uncharacterized protein (DUF1778 family)